MIQWDVCVVGAGPGGAITAGQLARKGLKVLLLEKDVLPRYKTCGGGITARALKLLPESVRTDLGVPCPTIEFHFPKDRLSFTVHRQFPIILMAMRDEFDFKLTEWAREGGAQINAAEKVEEIEPNPDHVEIKTSKGNYRARFIVGADGVHSTVAKQTYWPKTGTIVPAIEYEYEVSSDVQKHYQEICRLDYDIPEKGYAWVFPKRNHLSIGLGTVLRGLDLHKELERYLQLLGITPTRLIKKSGFVIPLAPRGKLLAQGRVILVGDAAGLADPLTAEGIYSSLLTGELAATCLFEENLDPVNVTARYQAELDRGILTELSAARILYRAYFGHPWLRKIAFRFRGRYFCERMTDQLAGVHSYSVSLEKRRKMFNTLDKLGLIKDVFA